MSRLGAALALSCALVVACDDPVCPSEVFVAIQTSQVVVDSDAVAPGIQTSVRVRTSLDEGEEVTLEVFSGSDASLGTSTATTDADGLAIFDDITVENPVTRLRASVSTSCGDADDELVIGVSGGSTCVLIFSPGPENIAFYAPAGVYNSLTDPDPATPGYQAKAVVSAVPNASVEIFDNTGTGDVSLGTIRADATGVVELDHTLADGTHSFRAFCTSGDSTTVSAPVSIVTDTTPPTCFFETPSPGTTITPAFDNNLDLSDGIQLLVTAQIGGDDIQDEPTGLSFLEVGGLAQSTTTTKIDSSGKSSGFVTLAPLDSPAEFEFSFTARDHARNTCAVIERYNVILDGCEIAVTSPTAPVTTDAAPGVTGSQVDVVLQVSSECVGQTVTSDCGDDPSGVVDANGALTLRSTLCATSPCEASELCTFSVATPDGVITSTSSTIAFDDQGPDTTVAIVSPALSCGAVITPASDADPNTDGVQLVARVTSAGATAKSLRVNGGAPIDATGDVTVTIDGGTTSFVGIGVDALGNLGASAACNITLEDITISFAAPAADGFIARADGTLAAGAITFDLCGTVNKVGAAVELAIDGAAPVPATVDGTTWCRSVTLAESPPSHTIVATATLGQSAGTASLVLAVDLTAPPPVDNFLGSALDRRSLLMAFESPSDAGSPVTSYIAKVSTTPLTNANFDTTGAVITAPAPATPGDDQSVTFAPALLQLSYFLGIATVDAAGNRSVASITGPLSPFLDRTGEITPPNANLGALRFGTAIAYGKFNDDDIDDLAVSAPTQTAAGVTSAGAVYIYFGSVLGLGTTPDVTITSTVSNGRFGSGLTAVRWSSSTRDDLVVGAPGIGHGQIAIFRGGSITAGPRDAATADALITVSTSAPSFFTNGSLGSWLVTADVDGEGTPDLVASVPTGGSNNGGAIILYGDTFPQTGNVELSDLDPSGANGAIVELFTDPTNSARRLGTYLHAVGPTLGILDATDDLALGYLDDNTTLDRIFILRGAGTRPSTPGVTLRAFEPTRDARIDYATTFATTELGAQITTLDDRDGDGTRDLVVSAHAFNNNRGQILVLAGDTVGTALTSDAGVTITAINGASGMRLGAIVLARSEVGSDIDMDGTEDLLVVGRQSGAVRGFLWYNNALPLGTTTVATASFSFLAPSSFRIGQVNRTGALGIARWVGDLDDDGLEDICWASRIDTTDDGSFEVFD